MTSVFNHWAAQTARRNNATEAEFTDDALAYPFAEGGFRWVAKGTYTTGARVGEETVCKWFKTGHIDEAEFFRKDMQAMCMAHDIVKEWNKLGRIDKLIKVNTPEVWEFGHSIDPALSGKKVLQEPFIHGYEKFNSNTGWADCGDSVPRLSLD